MKNPLTVDFQGILTNIEYAMYQIIMDTEHDNEYKCDSVRMYIDGMRGVVKDSTDMKDATIKALADEVEEMIMNEKSKNPIAFDILLSKEVLNFRQSYRYR